MPMEVTRGPLRDEPPSAYAISAWVHGEPGALGRVVNLTASRMIFIVPGVLLAGVRAPMEVIKISAGVSLALTVGLALTYRMKRRRGWSSSRGGGRMA